MKTLFGIFSSLLILACLAFTPSPTNTVVIDLGHGGKDPGSQYQDLNEKDLVLSLVDKLKASTKGKDIKLIFTRTSDEFISLNDRLSFIKEANPDLVISLHVNHSANTEDQGLEIFTATANAAAKKSEILAQSLIKSFKEQAIEAEIKNSELFLLKNLDCPAALIELGYMSNSKDHAFISSDEGQNKIIEAILNGVAN